MSPPEASPEQSGRTPIPFGRFADRYARFVPQRPWLMIVLSLLFAAICSIGLLQLSFDADTRTFFGEENEQYQALKQLEERFGKANSVLFVLTAKEGDLFTPDNLAAIEELTERAWYVPHSTRVDSLATYQQTRAVGDDIVVEPLFEEAAALDAGEAAAVRERALEIDDITNWLVSPDGRVTAVLVQILKPGQSRDETVEITRFARSLQDEIEANHPGVEIRLTGGVLADATFSEAGQNDMQELIPIMFGLIVITLAIGFRSFTATAITLTVVALSVVVALGIAGFLGMTINSATGGAPVVIMTLCVADCVHLLTLAKQEMARGANRADALVASLRFNLIAIFMTSLTDVIGFMALNFGDSPPLQELGNIVSIGVVAGFIFSVTLAPALVTLLPSSLSFRELHGRGLMQRISGFLIDRRRRLVTILALFIVGFGLGTTQIVYDDDFIHYFSEEYEFRRDTDYMQDNLTGLQVLQFVLPAGESEAIARPDYLRQVDAFAEWLRTQPEIIHVNAVSDIVKRLNSNLNGDDPAELRIPDERELVAQLLLFYELSVPFGQDLTSQIDITKSMTKLSAYMVHVTSADIRRIGSAAENWLRENAPEIYAPATGLSMAYAYLSKTNVEAMIDGTFVALLMIAFTMFLVLRNWRLALLSLLPNLFPALAALGLWGWLHGEVNLAVSVVASISFGIIVDDTTHFFAKYVFARRKGMTPRGAMRNTLEDVGLAVLVTSVVLVAGFIVLATSGFAISVHMGLLTAITVGIAVFAEFMLVPALLLWFDRRNL